MSLDAFKQFTITIHHSIEDHRDVWLYTRVSSKDQFANKSLTNQHDSGKNYCDKDNYNLVKIFGETYESASGDFTRKEFKNLIQSIRRAKKKPFAILIYKMSRFSRTGGSAIALATELIEELGVHLIEISSGKNTLTERGKLEIYERLLKAREENLERLEMTLPGLKRFLEEGNWLGTAPKGYDHYGPRVKDLNKIRGEQKLVINEEGKLLKKAWQWKYQGIRDCDIRKRLDDLGLKMSDKQLSKMWRVPFYCGVIINKMLGDKVVQGNHEGLISKKAFLKINERLNDRTKKQSGYKDDENLPLNKFIYSYQCNTSYTGYCVKRKGLYYYKNNRKGSGENISAKKMHTSFLELLGQYQLRDHSMVTKYVQTICYQLDTVFSEHIQKVDVHERKINTLKKKMKRLEERWIEEEITKAQYEEYGAKWKIELEELLKNYDTSKSNFSNHENLIEAAVKYSVNLPQMWKEGTLQTRRILQSMVFPTGILYDFKNGVSRTNRVNFIFESINSLSANYEGIKKGKVFNLENSPLLVAKTGVEPVTSGL